jgi:peptidoglycan hydrolase-like protein with peptidoglycan-binding domain
MQVLRDRSSTAPRRWRRGMLAAAAVLVLAAAGVAYVVYGAVGGGSTAVTCTKGGSCTTVPSPASDVSASTLSLMSVSPSSGATGVASDTTVTLRFSAAVQGGVDPTISPAVAGTWHTSGTDELVFTPSAPFIPYTTYTLTVPGGSRGIRATSGSRLDKTVTSSFTVADGSVTRLQQLLAMLEYLPLSYTPPDGTPATRDMALPQPGTLTWRWTGLPPQLTGQWVQGSSSALTKAAVMMFETQNGLPVDGIAGPKVWSALLADVASNKANTEPVTYVLVTKTIPEHLTAWVNGALQFPGIPVNTGVPGATTTDGTYEVFEHVTASHMSGTDVTGTKYTITTVPWASYFDGGQALHGFSRASYGFPQSNGCVEMRITTAGTLWPYTPIGTLVTVQGPPPS